MKENSSQDLNKKSLFSNLKINNNNLLTKENFYGRNNDKLKIENNTHSEIEAETLLNNILSYYQKGEYTHLLKLAQSIDEPYYTFFYWKIIYFKILTYQEIIQYKIYKYFKNNKLKQIYDYFTLFIKEIEEIIINLKNIKLNKFESFDDIQRKRESFLNYSLENKKKKINKKNSFEKTKIKKIIPEMIETLITYLLKHCYNFAKYCLYKNYFHDCIAFLSLGMRIIKSSFSFSSSPETLYWACHIYLFLSSLLISTNNFSSAKNYIVLILILCFIQLELRINNSNSNYNYFLHIQQETNEELYLNQIYFLMSIAFYHFGVCCENENNIQQAITCYEQSKYFDDNNSSTYQQDSDFYLFIEKLIQRANLRKQFISFIIIEEKNKKIEQDIIRVPKLTFNNCDLSSKRKEQKLERVKKYIENLKIMELDDDEPDLLNKINGKPFSKKVGIPTKNIHILNYMLNNKFNNYLKKPEKLQINNLTLEKRIEIQKEIKTIKRDELEMKNKNINYNKYLEIKIIEDNNNKSLKKDNFLLTDFKGYKKSHTFKRFNSFQTLNNTKIFKKKNTFFNKNISKKNIIKNLFIKHNFNKDDIVKENMINNQILINSMPKINIAKNNNSNINNYNSIFNYKDNSTSKSNGHYLLNLNNNISSRNNLNNSNYKINTINRKRKLFFPSSFPFSSLNIKNLNNIHTKNLPISLKKNYTTKQLNRKDFLTDTSIDSHHKPRIKSKLKIKKILKKSKSQSIKFNNLYMLNKNLMSKKDYLDGIYIKELKFQKDLLKCKSVEIYDNDYNDISVNNSFNKQKVYNNCDNFYHMKLKELINEKNKISEKEQLNILNIKIKKQNNNTNEDNEEKETLQFFSLENIGEKRFKRRGAIKDNHFNQNYLHLEKIMKQINKLKGKENLINLKLKKIRDFQK